MQFPCTWPCRSPTGDYRNRYPNPGIYDELLQLHGKTIFSTIDLKRAYSQIPVAEDDSNYAIWAFRVRRDALGFKNGTEVFQKNMHSILGHLDFITIYLDDLLMSSSGMQEHLEHLRIIFNTLLANRLRINWDKCVFAKIEINFLGFRVNAHGPKPPQEEVEAILSYPRLKTLWDLKRYLGAVNYFRAHVPHAAQAQALLNDQLRNAKKRDQRQIDWTPQLIET